VKLANNNPDDHYLQFNELDKYIRDYHPENKEIIAALNRDNLWFTQMDTNGNGGVVLEEFDRALGPKLWPEFYNKPYAGGTFPKGYPGKDPYGYDTNFDLR